jgi:predicted acetyltransferase
MPDPYDTKVKLSPTAMNRIVDVPRALAMLQAPEGSGRVSVGVTDAFCPENTGLYYLEWESGTLNVTKKAESFIHADMETNVTTLAQLVTGYIDPARARWRKDTEIRSGFDELARLFVLKDLYSFERF